MIRENKVKRNPFVHAILLYTNTLADVYIGSIRRIWKGGLSPFVSGYWLAIHLHITGTSLHCNAKQDRTKNKEGEIL